MKIFRNAIFLFITMAFLSGCFSVSTLVKLNKDGSGTLEEKVLVKPMNMFGQNQTDASQIYDEEELRLGASQYGESVTFKSGQAISEEGMNGYVAVYEFKDVNKLRLNENFAGKAIDTEGFGPTSAENLNQFITFDFKQGGTSQLKIIYPEREEPDETQMEGEMEWDDSDMEMDEEMMTMMKEMYSGMKFSLIIAFNGKIKETNATHKTDKSITLIDFDFSEIVDDPEVLKKMMGTRDMSPEEAQKMMEDLEHVKVETGKEIIVKFE